ncbi:MAG TPA: hypothetical protein VH419_06630 [Nocardioidaceae bacterium]|jgi:hypothetical protein
MNAKWWRQGGLLGIAFVFVWLVAVLVRGDPPAYDHPVGELRAYWHDHGDRYLVAQYVVVLAALTMLIPYMVAFTTLLGRAEGEPRIWSRISLIGGSLFVAVALAAQSAWAALAIDVDRLSDDAVVTLMQLDQGAYQAPPPLYGLFVAAASIVIVRTRAMSRWLGFMGLAIALGMLLYPLSLLFENPDNVFTLLYFFAYLAGQAWLLTGAIFMLRMREEEAVLRPSRLASPEP